MSKVYKNYVKDSLSVGGWGVRIESYPFPVDYNEQELTIFAKDVRTGDHVEIEFGGDREYLIDNIRKLRDFLSDKLEELEAWEDKDLPINKNPKKTFPWLK